MAKKPMIIDPCATCRKYNDAIDDAMENPDHYEGVENNMKYVCELFSRMANEEMDYELSKIVFPEICSSCRTGDHNSFSIYGKEGLMQSAAIAGTAANKIESIKSMADETECLHNQAESRQPVLH